MNVTDRSISHHLSPAAVDALRSRAAELWRLEPRFPDPEHRTDFLLRLHGLRLDLEALERRLRDQRVGPEDERTLFLCAARLDELTEHWTEYPTDSRREPQCA